MSVMSESLEMVMDQLGFGLPADEARRIRRRSST